MRLVFIFLIAFLFCARASGDVECQNRNIFECYKSKEPETLKHLGHVKKVGENSFLITMASGNNLSVKAKRQESGFYDHTYIFVGYKKGNHFAIFLVGNGFHYGGYLLIDRYSEDYIYLSGEPIFSKDYKRLLSISEDYESGYPNGIKIYNIANKMDVVCQAEIPSDIDLVDGEFVSKAGVRESDFTWVSNTDFQIAGYGSFYYEDCKSLTDVLKGGRKSSEEKQHDYHVFSLVIVIWCLFGVAGFFIFNRIIKRRGISYWLYIFMGPFFMIYILSCWFIKKELEVLHG